ncbi:MULTISPECIES: hypothetical protein [unclassified Leucobacter]|uniref:hypothetical protein n=1 Tax=unclassified Leucobacter TaxID=2621730 RepID=UPI0030168988
MKGTISMRYEVPQGQIDEALACLPEGYSSGMDGGLVEYRVWFGEEATLEMQRQAQAVIETALAAKGIDFSLRGTGVQISDSRPWWTVRPEGAVESVSVQAWDEHEAAKEVREVFHLDDDVILYVDPE